MRCNVLIRYFLVQAIIQTRGERVSNTLVISLEFFIFIFCLYEMQARPQFTIAEDLDFFLSHTHY